ncbi:hypothetical protein LINGRAHAP2_LOCUS26805 [Linum grandiflorum]
MSETAVGSVEWRDTPAINASGGEFNSDSGPLLCRIAACPSSQRGTAVADIPYRQRVIMGVQLHFLLSGQLVEPPAVLPVKAVDE